MKLHLDLQLAEVGLDGPSRAQMRAWAAAALADREGDCELSVRIVDEAESRQLNCLYRGKDNATNVLSFPADLPPGAPVPLLGDLVFCAPLIRAEALAQGKEESSHWAHLVVHGVLHLLGHDHETGAEAAAMEAAEVAVLKGLGLSNPYEID